MKDLTNSFGHLHLPVKALVIYQREKKGYDDKSDYYVESFDMDKQGCPVNGHPLSLRESNALAKALQANQKKALGFLNPKGLLPQNILYLKSTVDGYAVWRTEPQHVKLLFTESLGIPSETAAIPALIWRASRNALQIFAIADGAVREETPLCHAPFFNVYADGRVCMGNVQIAIPKDCGLEQFITLWQDYFFNSYFSHLFGGHSPVKGNIVQLWQSLCSTKADFPTDVLIENRYRLKNLIQ
ncbi:PRTRC genetic system protein B [Mucilaginibacter sp. UYP25]|uniref:PRTRC system protein B n=1 Tax=unclassified Mucilaginibacter TaxID=2617802 RepID=UPI003396234A